MHSTTEQIFEICPRSKVRITRVFGAKWPGRSGRCREATMAFLFLNYESIHTCSSVLIAVQAGSLNFVSGPHSWSAKTTSVALLFSKQYSLGTPSRLRRRGQCSWPQLGARIIGSSVLISLLAFSLDFGRVAPQQARQEGIIFL